MPDTTLPRRRVAAASRRPDGRTAYPAIVQYLLAAYDGLRQRGALEVGHRLPTAVPAIDNRTAPGA